MGAEDSILTGQGDTGTGQGGEGGSGRGQAGGSGEAGAGGQGSAGSGGEGGSGGESTASFFDTLPEDVRKALPKETLDHAAFKGVKDMEGLLKAHMDGHARLTGLGTTVEKPEDYEIPAYEGVTQPEAYVQGFRGVAHKIGLTKEQVKALADYDADMQRKNAEAYQASRKEFRESSLKKLQGPEAEGGWGPKYDENLTTAQKGLRMLANSLGEQDGKAFIELLKQSGGADHPLFIRAFFNAGRLLKEDAISGGDRGTAREEVAGGGRGLLNFPSMDKSD